MRILRRRAAMSAPLRSGRTLIAPSVRKSEVRRRSQAPLASKLAVLCQETFTVLPSGRYAPECTVRTIGKRRGFGVLIGPELGAVPSVQRKLVKVAHASTARRWVGRLLQLIAPLGSEALAACRIAVPRPEMRVRLGLALHPQAPRSPEREPCGTRGKNYDSCANPNPSAQSPSASKHIKLLKFSLARRRSSLADRKCPCNSGTLHHEAPPPPANRRRPLEDSCHVLAATPACQSTNTWMQRAGAILPLSTLSCKALRRQHARSHSCHHIHLGLHQRRLVHSGRNYRPPN
jgi:hypothetical protein